MVKKILSSIIIIMIIFSFTFVYATELPEGSLGETQQQEDTNKEDTTTPEGGNQNTGDSSGSTTKQEEDNNTNVNPSDNDNTVTNPDSSGSTDSIPDNNINTDNNVEKEENNTGNNNQGSNEKENNQTNHENNNTQQEQQKPTQNNQESSDNNYVQPKSSEARLKDLKVDVEGLTPEFNKNTTEYYLVVDLSVNKINVKASLVDSKAKWAIYGNKNLKEGENTITINVTAEDGTIKKYYIHVTKVDNVELANAELEKIEIEGFNLYPTFKSNIYSYNLNINQDISNLNITAVPLNEKATVEIEGNENLQEGENIIKINVTAANKETVRTYKINTYISLDRVELQEEDKTPAIVLIAVLGTCIIALGISIVVKNRK